MSVFPSNKTPAAAATGGGFSFGTGTSTAAAAAAPKPAGGGFSFGSGYNSSAAATPSLATSTTTPGGGGFSFGSGFSSATTAAAAPTPNLGGGGLTTAAGGFNLSATASTTAASATSLAATATTNAFNTNPGLGGISSTTADIGGAVNNLLNPNNQKSAHQNVNHQKPKDTNVPDELVALFEDLKKHIREDKTQSDEISLNALKDIPTNRKQLQSSAMDIESVNCRLYEIRHGVNRLNNKTREMLNDGQYAMYSMENVPNRQTSAQSLRKLIDWAKEYEGNVVDYRKQLGQLERILLANQHRMATPGDSDGSNPNASLSDFDKLQAHMRRMEMLYQHLYGEIQVMEGTINDLKRQIMRYRRGFFGETAGDPFAATSSKRDRDTTTKRAGATVFKLEAIVEPGPNPFLAAANHIGAGLGQNQNAPTSVGVGAAQATTNTGLFGTAAAANKGGFNFGGGNPTAVGGNSLFAPKPGTGIGMLGGGGGGLFGGAGNNTGVGVGANNNASIFGSNALQSSVITGNNANNNNSLGAGGAAGGGYKFSSTFSANSTGTLFGGSATAANTATVRPFGK